VLSLELADVEESDAAEVLASEAAEVAESPEDADWSETTSREEEPSALVETSVRFVVVTKEFERTIAATAMPTVASTTTSAIATTRALFFPIPEPPSARRVPRLVYLLSPWLMTPSQPQVRRAK
jgi:hypothetical protein